MRKFKYLLSSLMSLAFLGCSKPKGYDFLVYYGEPPKSMEVLDKYDILILEGEYKWSLPDHLKPKSFGYISVGELSSYRPFYSRFSGADWIVEANPDWPKSYRVDFRSEEWQSFLLNEWIPSLVEKGFGGLFFDTAETPLYLEDMWPTKYAGNQEALENFTAKVRKRYPKLKIIINNSLATVEVMGDKVDYLLLESLNASFDFEKETYKKSDSTWRAGRISRIQEIQKMHPHVQILSLDYPGKNQELFDYSCEANSKLGFKSFMGHVGLNTLPGEPLSETSDKKEK